MPKTGLSLAESLEGTVGIVPIPSITGLESATKTVLSNNHVTARTSAPANPFSGIGLSAGKITHVLYIVKENRTYDQVLGDLPEGNGDQTGAFWPDVTPNQHALAERFVLLG